VSVAALALFGAIQLVPYGRGHVNPAVVLEPVWDAPETRVLARRACLDCHSNETTWPAYAGVAPGSWLIHRDVFKARQVVNFSEWQRPQEEAAESAEAVREREMPPLMYRMMRPEARLTADERERLARGLTNTIGAAVGEDED